MKFAYRPDIDGLRALAVVPVVLFHAGVPGFSGGYVGVDIFFVISGYLITGIIASQIDDGTFTILGFYERRVRRIFPALCVMLALVLAASYVYILPQDYGAAGKTALSALFSFSNFTFYEEAGYFDEVSIVKPFLHTWSLAVEEQFYLLLPPLLIIASRFIQQRVAIVWGIAAVSLACALVTTSLNQDFAFYLLPARAWELLAGSLLALGAFPKVGNGRAREAISVIGLFLIIAPVFLLDADTPFPGPGAILPVLGAVLLIHCAPETLVGRTLGIAPLRGIGLISYSLYLWHWPVIVLISYYHQAPLTLSQAAIAILVALALSILSWRFVEQPFRRRSVVGRRPLWTSVIASSAVLGLAAAGIMLLDGLPRRFGAEVAHFYRANNVSPLTSECRPLPSFEAAARSDACLIGEQTAAPSLAVWGDSHARPLASALYEAGPVGQRPILRFSKGGCPPSLAPVIRKENCTQYNSDVIDYFAAHPEIRQVVVAVYFESDRNAGDPAFGPGYNDAVNALLGMNKQVVLVGPIPRQPFDVARKLSLSTFFGTKLPDGVNTAAFLDDVETSLQLVRTAAAGKAAIVLPQSLLCNDQSCSIIRDGDALYIDDNHLSKRGAQLVAAQIRALLDQGAHIAGN